MSETHHLIAQILAAPEVSSGLTPLEWDLAIRQARSTGVMARLAVLLDEQDLIPRIPEKARNHLYSAKVLAERHADSVKWEVSRIRAALAHLGVRVILLKGAAYLMARLPPARGRLFSDVDILVPRGALDEVEGALRRGGWRTTHQDEYDQRYYRQWMHELPPLQHARRGTVLDVHHTIIPPTSRPSLDAGKLLEDASPLAGLDPLHVLAPPDMVLHSAAHLFHDGELEHGLRDLVDLGDLLRHFSSGEDFWRQLVGRAAELDLNRPLYYALRYTHRLLGIPIPQPILETIAPQGPRGGSTGFVDALFTRGLAPNHASCDDGWTALARWMLYLRSHYLRMPLYLLVPHLVRKSVKRRLEA